MDSVSFVEHPSDIVAAAAALIEQGQRFALITSMAIEGGAARDVGSLALVDAQGQMVGYLSNGCIDRDIQLHAKDALASNKMALIRYGDGSRYADLKLPCGGALSVLIDPAPDTDAILAAHARFCARAPATMTFEGPDGIRAAFTYLPKFRLVMAGRGAVFRAVAEVARSAGFQVYALSPDVEDIAAVSEVVDAPAVHLTAPSQPVDLGAVDAYSAFLTLFHDHDWEPALLQAALARPAVFIGSLGSRRTHDARLGQLAAAGVPEDDLARLKGPIGLVPSLREAPLIALSAMAEIVANLPSAIE